jgi:hypothetical protein
MVAYSYKGRFVAPIRISLGLPVLDLHYELGFYLPGQPIRPKRQTIRANGRRRHARPGETLQLYYGMRTSKCFKIGEARCSAVSAIRVFVHGDRVLVNQPRRLIEYRKPSDLDMFARDDGFDDWAGMRAFWLEVHDDKLKQLGPFVGVLIQWEAI